MKPRAILALASVLAFAVITTLVAAHDLFIKMDSYFLAPNAPVRVPIINGTFELSENSMTPDRVTDISLISANGRQQLGTEEWNADGDTTFLALRTGAAGTYVLGVSTRPNDLELVAADFNEYLAHDGIPDVLMRRALDRELDADVTEQYSKHVKAVFQVGEATTDGFDRVLGYPAEVVPVTNPYQAALGREMVFRAMVDGRPVADQLVLAGGQGIQGLILERSARTDAEGFVRFVINKEGRWYIKFINMQKTSLEGVDYESKWATLTFEVRSPGGNEADADQNLTCGSRN